MHGPLNVKPGRYTPGYLLKRSIGNSQNHSRRFKGEETLYPCWQDDLLTVFLPTVQ